PAAPDVLVHRLAPDLQGRARRVRESIGKRIQARANNRARVLRIRAPVQGVVESSIRDELGLVAKLEFLRLLVVDVVGNLEPRQLVVPKARTLYVSVWLSRRFRCPI